MWTCCQCSDFGKLMLAFFPYNGVFVKSSRIGLDFLLDSWTWQPICVWFILIQHPCNLNPMGRKREPLWSLYPFLQTNRPWDVGLDLDGLLEDCWLSGSARLIPIGIFKEALSVRSYLSFEKSCSEILILDVRFGCNGEQEVQFVAWNYR